MEEYIHIQQYGRIDHFVSFFSLSFSIYLEISFEI